MSEQQTDKMLKMLRKAGKRGVENYKFTEVRMLRYSSVVQDLRAQGHDIYVERVFLPNGRATNVYKYYLNEPKAERVGWFIKKHL